MLSLVNDFINHNLTGLAEQGYKLWFYKRNDEHIKFSPLGGPIALFKSPDRSRCAFLGFYQWDEQKSEEAKAALAQLISRLEDTQEYQIRRSITCIMVLVLENKAAEKEAIDLYEKNIQRYGKIKIKIAVLCLAQKKFYPSDMPMELHFPKFNFSYETLSPAEIDPSLGQNVKKVERVYTKIPWAVYLLILLNIIFFAFSFTPDPVMLMRTGALDGYLFWEGEYWRILSSIGLHMGMAHLTGNCFALYLFGTKVEEYFGIIRLFIIYVVAGLWGSIACLLLNPLIPTLGASGAIFGLSGALLYIFFRQKEIFKLYLICFLIFAIFSIVQTASDPMVSTCAHVGGFIGGFFIAFVIGILGDSINTRVILKSILFLITNLVLFSFILIPPKKGALSRCWQAHTLARGGNFSDANELLFQMLESSDRSFKKEVLYKKALINAQWGDQKFKNRAYQEAVYYYQISIKDYDLNSPLLYYHLAQAYQEINDMENAAIYFQKSAELKMKMTLFLLR